MADLNWKYKIIPKLLNKSEIKFTHEYCKQKHIKNTNSFDELFNNCADTGCGLKIFDRKIFYPTVWV